MVNNIKGGLPSPDKVFYWHYAWVIVIVVVGMQVVASGVRMAFGALIDPLNEEFGWTQTNIGIAYAISSLVSAFVSPWAGSLGDRYGVRIATLLGTIIFFAGMILTAFVVEVWHFWFTYGVVLGVSQAIFLVPLIPAAMIWFRRHLGLAMGLIFASFGIGPAISTPIVAYLLTNLGWKMTFIYLGIASTGAMLLMVIIFRNRPQDINQHPYGTIPGDSPINTKAPPIELYRKFKAYMRSTKAYWNLSSIHFLGCVGHAVVIVWLIPMATQQGLTLVNASLVLTVLSVVSIVTRIATPMLCERYGVRTVMGIFYVMQGLPVFLLFFVSSPAIFLVFAVSFGIGYGGETGGFPILNRKYYGHAPMGDTHGFQMLGAGIGMAFGGWIGGPVFDIFGSYDWAIGISLLASLGGALSIVLLENPARLLIPDWEVAEKEYDE